MSGPDKPTMGTESHLIPWGAWAIGIGGGVPVGAILYALHLSPLMVMGVSVIIVSIGVIIRSEEGDVTRT